MKPKKPRAIPGKLFASEWESYKLWQADLYECRSCGMQIVVGSGLNAIAIQHMPEYKKMLEERPPEVEVYDC
jgi:hypothetical protein